MIDETVSHYKIKKKIGEGGMGEVYLAEDVSLPRKVAIKFRSELFDQDETARKRFQREAQSAAALDHPYICHINEVSSTTEGRDFIVMEYVEGRTLKDRLAEGPLPLRLALQVGVEIAEALEVAHAAGIVHRDLKPANIMITPQGHAKIMDFGLAKRLATEHDMTRDVTSELTREGLTLGTPAYMSPEQIRAEPVDHRSDLFSFGIVFYEMLTGVHPFRKATQSETAGAILHVEPAPLAGLLGGTPEALEQILAGMLSKDPAKRWQTAGEIRTRLDEVREASISRMYGPGVGAPKQRRLPWLLAGVVSVLLLAGAAALYWGWIPPSRTDQAAVAPVQAIRFTSDAGSEECPDFSPQGDRIAFHAYGPGPGVQNCDIYVKQIGPGDPLRLTTDPAADVGPRWSPDGRVIAFGRQLSADRDAILTVPALGGPERTIAEVNGTVNNLSWSPDGTLLAVSMGRIFLLHVGTGEMIPFSSPPEGAAGDFNAEFSPDGQKVLFFRPGPDSAGWNLYLQPLAGGEPERVSDMNFGFPVGAAWKADTEEIIFGAQLAGSEKQGLWRMRMNGGEPVLFLASNEERLVFGPAVSRQGNRLAYLEQNRTRFMMWRFANPVGGDPKAPPLLLSSSSRSDFRAFPSPDGSRIAFASDRSGYREIHVSSFDGSGSRQVTYLKARAAYPSWSPDGRKISFAANRGDGSDLFVARADGGTPHTLTEGPSNDISPTWSRDGRWIYFDSNRSGTIEVWKIPSEGGEPVQVTQDGGRAVQESADGYLYYSAEDGIRRIPVAGGEPAPVFQSDVSYFDWALGSKGIYFLKTKEGNDREVDFFEFGTGTVRKVLDLGLPTFAFNMNVSPDEKWFFTTTVEKSVESDIMLVEDFH